MIGFREIVCASTGDNTTVPSTTWGMLGHLAMKEYQPFRVHI